MSTFDKRLFERAWVGPLLALVGVYALFAALAPETFLGSMNVVTMARQTAVVALCAVGMTLIVIQGGIDLSVGSVVALTTVLIASALESGSSPFVAVALGVLVATACGVLNGALVAKLDLAPFIVTLGTMSILRGTAKGLADEQKIDVDPKGLEDLMLPSPLVLPTGVWLTLAIAVLAAGFLGYTPLGRHIVAMGSSPATARMCGVPTSRVTLVAYALGGLLAGLAGLLEFSTLTVGDPTDSLGLELEVIAAVVIGGGSLAGGQGSIAGTLLGAALLTVIKTGCTHVGLPNWVQEIVTGGIIVLAMGIDRYRALRRR
jgi:ribose/xylose/arabinose/galactoside ABC-type transport system permease subunit